MTAPVEFGLALSNSYPSGTGSYNYDGSFKIVVQNLAFNKQVSIWAQAGATWNISIYMPATYSHCRETLSCGARQQATARKSSWPSTR